MRFDIDAIADHTTDLPHMLASPADFAVAMRRLGVEPSSTVVVYDSTGVFSAPRLWWNLRVMGHRAAFVLDGGLPRWASEGRPLETGWREPPHGDFKAHRDERLVRDLDQMRGVVAARGAQVLDARSADRFRGEAPEPRPGLRPGHMPGALNLPWTAVVTDGALVPTRDLEATFARAGVDLTRPIVTTCGSGVSASVLALALARLGRFDVPVYDGSWAEWAARADTPVAIGS
jgi:thiosulfate/3-mercaptopyruvate sulfurtransferase